MNDSDWSYQSLLPYFKKFENFTKTNPSSPIDYFYHGYGGPVHITQSIPPEEISRNLLKGSQQLGYPLTDYNGKRQSGASVFQIFTKDGKRYNHQMAFISSARKRYNLDILDRSYVIKIEINVYSKNVEGVIFTRNNKTYIARNRKEVILSAGAICSPQILMLSGVGPQRHLEHLGIPVIQNLPVGKFLRDQVLSDRKSVV